MCFSSSKLLTCVHLRGRVPIDGDHSRLELLLQIKATNAQNPAAPTTGTGWVPTWDQLSQILSHLPPFVFLLGQLSTSYSSYSWRLLTWIPSLTLPMQTHSPVYQICLCMRKAYWGWGRMCFSQGKQACAFSPRKISMHKGYAEGGDFCR